MGGEEREEAGGEIKTHWMSFLRLRDKGPVGGLQAENGVKAEASVAACLSAVEELIEPPLCMILQRERWISQHNHPGSS